MKITKTQLTLTEEDLKIKNGKYQSVYDAITTIFGDDCYIKGNIYFIENNYYKCYKQEHCNTYIYNIVLKKLTEKEKEEILFIIYN